MVSSSSAVLRDPNDRESRFGCVCPFQFKIVSNQTFGSKGGAKAEEKQGKQLAHMDGKRQVLTVEHNLNII